MKKKTGKKKAASKPKKGGKKKVMQQMAEDLATLAAAVKGQSEAIRAISERNFRLARELEQELQGNGLAEPLE
jgi:hypothetical protein